MHRDVEQGAAALFNVERGGHTLAVTLLTVEGDTLEILALAGHTGGLDGLRDYLQAVELLAALLELKRVWLQTPRPGLVKWVKLCGYEFVEISASAPWVLAKPVGLPRPDVLHRRQQLQHKRRD